MFKDKEKIALILLYSLAHGWLLFGRGIYGDDWILLSGRKTVLDLFSQTGVAWVGHFHNFLHTLSRGAFFYRLFVFLSYLFAGLFMHSILRGVTHITSRLHCFFIALFFMVFPVNNARIAQINAPAALCYFAFYLAFWLVSLYFTKAKKVPLRVAALLLFSFSFFINSFLVFYSVVLLYIVYMERSRFPSRRSPAGYVAAYFDFLLIPALFWTLKNVFFSPHSLPEISYSSGLHMIPGHKQELVGIQPMEEYYAVGLYGILRAILQSFSAFYTSFFTVLDAAAKYVSFSAFLFASLFTLVFLKKDQHDSDEQDKNMLWLFAAGIFSFYAAVFPYYVVGKIPHLMAFESRHQLLVPLGAGLLLTAGLHTLFRRLELNRKTQVFIFALLAGFFIQYDIYEYLSYERDWYKQLSLTENFKSSGIIKNHATFLFKDNTLELNVNDRMYTFYDYTGLFKSAFGDEKRFGDNYSGYNRISSKYSLPVMRWNMREYKPEDPEYKVIISYGDYRVTNTRVLRLKYLELFAPAAFRQRIQNIVLLEFEKL